MAYYLLRITRSGSVAYKEAASSKHHVDAHSLDDAKWRADAVIDAHYTRIDKAVMELFDETGLVATRHGDGEWVSTS